MNDSSESVSVLSSELITAAVSGEPMAMRKSVQHYENYIVRLSLRKNYENDKNSSVYVDEFFKRSLECKLIEKITTFDVTR